MRPALILVAPDQTERRLLAELDDKPWAAEDGDPWHAAFLLDGEVPPTTRLELSVAPDITVVLSGPPAPDAPEGSGDERAPGREEPPVVSRHRPAGRGPGPRAPDTERLAGRLAAAERALERERERRGEAESVLEDHRSKLRGLSAELGRTRAELELARAAERESAETAALLDAARRDHHATQARYEALSAEHDRSLRAIGELREQLDSRSGALESTREALAGERAARGKLEARTARAESTASPGAGHRGAGSGADGERSPGTPEHPLAAAERQHGTHVPHTPPLPRSDRPMNPSLRAGSWPLRLLAVLVIAAFALAVYLVLSSTVLH